MHSWERWKFSIYTLSTVFVPHDHWLHLDYFCLPNELNLGMTCFIVCCGENLWKDSLVSYWSVVVISIINWGKYQLLGQGYDKKNVSKMYGIKICFMYTFIRIACRWSIRVWGNYAITSGYQCHVYLVGQKIGLGHQHNMECGLSNISWYLTDQLLCGGAIFVTITIFY